MPQVSIIDSSWKNSDFKILLPIFLSFIVFTFYWLTIHLSTFKKYFFSKYSFDEASIKYSFFNKCFGFITLGIIPSFICFIFIPEYSLTDLGLTIIPEKIIFTLTWICCLGIIVIPLVYINAKKPQSQIHYPQLRIKVWNGRIIFVYCFGWTLYLLGYEFLFRGIFLFPLVDSLGMWPAIIINIILYAASHIPNGIIQTVGAIPLGLVFCLLTLSSGTIWIAYFVHLIIAITNSAVAFKFHPD